jgi:hypothetical protein
MTMFTAPAKCSDVVFADYFSLQEHFNSSHADGSRISDVRMACLSVTYRPGCHNRYITEQAAQRSIVDDGLRVRTVATAEYPV